jgi:hypothetical protein
MELYALADLHLSFAEEFSINNNKKPNMSKPMDVFGENWNDHYIKIWLNWTKTVKQEDTVLIPGDISWALKLQEAVYDFDFLEKLPGKKILCKGNHDYWWQSLKKMNNFVSEKISFLQNNCIILNNEIVLCGTRGWVCPNDINFKKHDEKIYNRELIRLENSLKKAPRDKKIIVMMHYPPVNDKKEKSRFIEIMESYAVKKCIYGHLHGYSTKMRIEGKYWDINFNLVSADYLEFKPKLIKF